ncbi:ISKra4 family transposase [Streptomyces longwoodensis]|uniref:ISKra4 family transposase n=1 Tax=Streptomyces longwoodensis TaxID=68231 RepID=UPI0033EC5AA3
MERYDVPSEADSFEGATKLFGTLVKDLQGPAAGELGHHDLEELIGTRGREVLRQLFQDHLQLRRRREAEAVRRCRPLVRGPEGLVRPRLEHGHRRLLATVFGTVTVSRCAWRRLDASNVHPVDAALSLPRGRYSHGLARLAVLEATRGSFDAARAAIARRCGNVIGKRQLEREVVHAARDIDAFYHAHVVEPCTADTMLVISVDGKGIVMRPEALREATRQAAAKRAHTFRTRLASGEKSARKRMATLGVVYDAKPAPRRPHDVIAPPGGRPDGGVARPGPKARGKWLCGSVIHDAEQVISRVFDHAEARDPGHRRRWVVLVDGARHQLDVIQAEAAQRGIALKIVIDIVHALEYLWQATWSFHGSGDPAAEDWVATHALALLAGDAVEVADAIEAQADRARLTEDQRRGADRCVNYLHSNAAFMHYDQALAAGWPIASGVIEGACRHLIADRLDVTGSRWGLAGAEAVLKLRAVTANGHLETYWKYHVTAEHQRLYPTPDQAQYDLTA